MQLYLRVRSIVRVLSKFPVYYARAYICTRDDVCLCVIYTALQRAEIESMTLLLMILSCSRNFIKLDILSCLMFLTFSYADNNQKCFKLFSCIAKKEIKTYILYARPHTLRDIILWKSKPLNKI